jgi:hypothetical protein
MLHVWEMKEIHTGFWLENLKNGNSLKTQEDDDKMDPK